MMPRLAIAALVAALVAAAVPAQDAGQFVGGPEHAGQRVTAELPESLMMWNRGGSDRAGMCVMTSIEMVGMLQNVPGVKGLRDWCAREPGGAGPRKVDDQMKRYYRKVHDREPPEYRQYEGRDLEAIARLIDKTGRPMACTYGQSPRYEDWRNPRGIISHMVWSARYRGDWCVIVDNNPVGGVKAGSRYEWLTDEEGMRRIKAPRGVGWIFVWLAPPPPPPRQPPDRS